jgi:MraZ protein
MFIGSFIYRVGPKNRICVPAKFKNVMKPEAQDTFVMTRSVVECIDLYPLDYWEAKIKPRIDALDDFDDDESAFKRFLFELASDQVLDKQLRIFVPKNLFLFAGIEKEVLILGQNNKIELWNPGKFEAQKRDFPKPFAELAKQVMTQKPK